MRRLCWFHLHHPQHRRRHRLRSDGVDNRQHVGRVGSAQDELGQQRLEVVQKDPGVTFYSVSDGSKRTVTARALAGINSIDFAADGRSLWAPAYTNDGKWALLNIDLKGRTRIVLEDTNTTIGWAIPAPDGHHLALWEARGNSNVWMLERF